MRLVSTVWRKIFKFRHRGRKRESFEREKFQKPRSQVWVFSSVFTGQSSRTEWSIQSRRKQAHVSNNLLLCIQISLLLKQKQNQMQSKDFDTLVPSGKLFRQKRKDYMSRPSSSYVICMLYIDDFYWLGVHLSSMAYPAAEVRILACVIIMYVASAAKPNTRLGFSPFFVI